MSLFAIADLHLSLNNNKPMDVFKGWDNYVEKLENNWNKVVGPEDTVVIAGDISWGMTLEESLRDFQFIHALPGKKIILKGNHDYWWTTYSKMTRFLQQNGLDSIQILHNNAFVAEEMALCGTRGWIFDENAAVAENDSKILNREVGRLATSVAAAKKTGKPLVAFLHYPPIYAKQTCPEILAVLHQNGISRCYYGHIHGAGARYAVNGKVEGIDFRLIACDYLGFMPLKVTG